MGEIKQRKNPTFNVIISEKIKDKTTIEFFEKAISMFKYELRKYKILDDIKSSLGIIYAPDKDRDTLGEYDRPLIFIYESPLYFEDTSKRFIGSRIDPTVLKMVWTLFHEFGHFYYRQVITHSCRDYFKKYIDFHTKNINIEKLNKILEKHTPLEINKKFPLIGMMIDSLQYHTRNAEQKIYMFTRPLSSYMPDSEEIFCELFARYMLDDYKNKHSKIKYYYDNFNIIQNILINNCVS